MARRKDGLDGRGTFASRWRYHCKRYRELFGDDAADQDLVEHAALIAARIDKLRVKMFDADGITDETDDKLIALTRCLVAVQKQLGTIKKRTERAPSLAEYLAATEAEDAETDDD